uniref:Phospholipase A2-like central domain-containing protein n=1 Tax=Leptobrachium leishanense TaxID=445787 RepID=A0A8C5N3I6_9ANUR
MWDIPTLFLSSLIYVVLGFPNERNSLGIPECGLISSTGEHTVHQVTDGKELLVSIWDSRRQLVSCSVEVDEDLVSSFLSQCLLRRQHAAEDLAMDKIKLACHIFLQAVSPPWGTGVSPGHGLHRVKRGFTYPGTLWCGSGNTAESFEDLGEHRETDTCCRTHDQCEHVIHPFSYNYGYRNLRWHTISHCECDNKCKTYTKEKVAEPKDSGLYDYGGKLIDQVYKEEETNPTIPPSAEPLPLQPTLGSIIQATEDLLKLMMTVSPSTNDHSKVETTTKSEKEKKKDRKNKKGKGLKGKRGKGLKGKKKSQSSNGNFTSPTKVLWSEDIMKNEMKLSEKQPLDSIIHDLGEKEDPFNDVLNDEPRQEVTTQLSHETFINAEHKNMTTTLPQKHIPYTERPQKKNNPLEKRRRQRKKNKVKTFGGTTPSIE